MNVESYRYTLIVVALGMGVVFAFLWFLSAFMSFTRKLLKDNGDGERRVEPQTIATASGSLARAQVSSGRAPDARTTAAPTGAGAPRWVIAAAAAFVLLEEYDALRTAEAWRASSAADPWIDHPRF